jgi:hypothetical protein
VRGLKLQFHTPPKVRFGLEATIPLARSVGAAISLATGVWLASRQSRTMGRHRSQQTAASWSGRLLGIDPGPSGAQQWCCVRLRHIDRAVRGHAAADAGQQLDLPNAARGARRLRSAKLFGALPVEFEDPRIGAGTGVRLAAGADLREPCRLPRCSARAICASPPALPGSRRAGVGELAGEHLVLLCAHDDYRANNERGRRTSGSNISPKTNRAPSSSRRSL